MLESPGKPTISSSTLRLREELSNLPCTSVVEFFAGVRKIAKEYDQKYSEIETELAYVQQTLPEKLEKLRNSKKELLTMREEMLLLRDGYLKEAKTILDSIKKNAPFVLEKMESIAKKKEKLRRLECMEETKNLVFQCQKSIELKDILDSCKYFDLLINNSKLMNEMEEDYLLSLNELIYPVCSELIEFVNAGISTILLKLSFPFDDAIDHNAFKSDISSLIDHLVLLYKSQEVLAPSSGSEAVLAALFSPIKKRFLYFFYGDRKTNDISKPQWFLSLALSWFQTSLPFFELVLSAVASKLMISLEPSIYFHKSMSDLVIQKTSSLLENEEVRQESFIFSHLVDECISYEEQRILIDIGQFGGSIMDILSRQDILSQWITIEKDCCIAKIDDILASPNRWQNHYALIEDADQYFVCECTEAFVSLVQGLQQRSHLLTEEAAQHQFVDLQLILVDDFRQRLVQIASQAESPWMEPYPQVMNAIWYLHDVVGEWSETCILSGLLPLGTHRLIFEESKQLYEHVWTQMADDVVSSLRIQCIGLVKEYQQQRWNTMEARLSNVERELSSSFCPLLMKIRSSYSTVGSHFSKISISKLFKTMNSVIGRLILEDVVRETSYNSEGGAQMLHDIEKGLLPALNFVFSRCCMDNLKAEHDEYFVQLLGSLRLLSMTWAVATLLRDELHNAPEEVAEEKLAAMNLFGLKKENAVQLLKQRTDLTYTNNLGSGLSIR